MSKRTRTRDAAASAKREKVVLEPAKYADGVVTLLRVLDDEEEQHLPKKVPDVVSGLSKLLFEIEEACAEDEQALKALLSLMSFTEALHKELVSEEIRRLERLLINSELFQNLMVTWMQVVGKAPPKDDHKSNVTKMLHDVHFELSKRGVEVLEPVLEMLGEKVSPAAREAAKAARASQGGNSDEEGSEFDDEEEDVAEDDDDDDDEEDAEEEAGSSDDDEEE